MSRPLPSWYDDAKFGIFIHWGPYAVPCYAPVDRDMGDLFAAGNWEEVFRWSPYTEWYLNSWALEGSPTAAHHAATYGDRQYSSFVEEFRQRSAGVDVASWAPLFAQAGARYVVPVTKHHDGFLMWHSSVANPHRAHWMAERDHIAELAAAVRDLGIRFGLYYSGGLDWTFQPPPIRDLMGLFSNVPSSAEYAAYATAHVDELIARFCPSVLWNDIGWPGASDPAEVIGRFYDAVPDGVVNDRFNVIAVAQGTLHADFNTPEYSTTHTGTRKWEVCRGIGRSFGYNRMESEATFPSVDGGGAGVDADGREVRFTERDGSRYVIVKGAPANELRIELSDPAAGSEVRMLGNSRALPYTWRAGELRVELPDHLPAAPATVLQVR